MRMTKSVTGLAILLLSAGMLTACGQTSGSGSSNNSSGSGGATNSSTNTSTNTSSNSSSNASSSSNSSSNAAANSSSNAAATTSSSTSSGGKVVIAVTAPFSGNESFIGPRFLNGVKVAVAEINKDGGVLGGQLSIVTGDTAGDPVDAVPSISQIISTNHPNAMIGPSSLTITSVDQQLNSDKLVDVTLGGTTQLDTMTMPYIFRTTPSDSQLGVAMAYYGNQKGYTKVATAFTTDSAAQTLVPPIQDTVKKHGGTVVANIKLSPDQSAYRSEVEKLIAAKPQVIYTQLDPQTAATFISEWQQLGGGNIPFVGSDVTAASDFLKAVTPKWAQKNLVSIEGSTSGGTAASEYATMYGAMFNGDQPIALSNNAYDAVNIIALAMLEAKSTTPADYVSYMEKVANGPGTKVYDFKTGAAAIANGESINYEGATGPDDFNQYHNVTGAFEAVQSDGTTNVKSVSAISASALLGY